MAKKTVVRHSDGVREKTKITSSGEKYKVRGGGGGTFKQKTTKSNSVSRTKTVSTNDGTRGVDLSVVHREPGIKASYYKHKEKGPGGTIKEKKYKHSIEGSGSVKVTKVKANVDGKKIRKKSVTTK